MKNNKWKGSGEGSSSSGNHNQNEETDKKSGGNHKVGKKKFNNGFSVIIVRNEDILQMSA